MRSVALELADLGKLDVGGAGGSGPFRYCDQAGCWQSWRICFNSLSLSRMVIVYFKGNQGERGTYGAMASESEILCDSGPKSPSVNWNDTQYRRCVIARLVEGVYILENYRHQNGDVPQGLALPSWDSCGFHLKEWLTDNDGIGKSIICATYEYKSPSPDDPNIPQYVIAFRGTILESKDTMFRDIEVNTQCVYNRLHKNPSFQNAMQYVQNQNTDALSRGASLWLAGHSLGSAMALLVGKKMARMDHFLETYLFDPPFYSVSVKFELHIMKSVLKAGASKLAAGIGRQHHEAQAHEDPFDQLSNWFPHLFVNRYDIISKVYIKYFKYREKMEKIGMGKLERHATKQSLMKLFTNVFGYSDSEAEALHLLPSVNLIINKGQFRQAHGIKQWYNPSLSTEFHQYQYNPTT